jgi:hypothetical protein
MGDAAPYLIDSSCRRAHTRNIDGDRRNWLGRSRNLRRHVLVLAVTGVAIVGSASAAGATKPQRVNFLAKCKVAHTAPDDPIVYPGMPGRSHQHTFFGNRSTNAFSTAISLRGRGTTCSRPSDSAAYWVPTLYQRGREIRPTGAVAYYTLRQFSNTRAYPAGLKMIAGYAHARTPQPIDHVWWNCGAFGGVKRASKAPRSCPDHLELHVRFPDCWDGRRLDSPDHRSHLAYQSHELCPRTHPVRLPSFVLIVSYPLTDGRGVELASGGQLSGHADLFNAWNQRELERIVRDCGNALPHCQRAH